MNIFNVRVYGLLEHNNCVLITDEYHAGQKITKFPGGGLQFGESTHDCVKREFIEELQLPVEVTSHFYTVDFFQASAFNPSQQVISIYYRVAANGAETIPVTSGRFDFPEEKNGAQIFRWLPFEKMHPEEFTFPIDKKVAELLAATHGS